MQFKDFIPYYSEIAPEKSRDELIRQVRRYAFPMFGDKPIEAINYDDLHKLFHSRRLLGKNVTRNVLKSTLSCILNHAERLGYRPPGSNPCKYIPNWRTGRRRRYLTPTEAQRLVLALRSWEKQDMRATAVLYVLLYSGARPAEILNARWDQLQGDVLILQDHKTERFGDERRIFLPPQAMNAIKELPRDHVRIFRRVTMRIVTYVWRKVCRMAEIKDLRLYDLRHTFASLALSSGYSLAQVGELLGHKSPATTLRYAHLVDEQAKKAAADTAAAIGRMLSGQGVG